MATLFLRTIIMYLVVIGAMRLMGKRQVGELQISELVITFMLSELATVPVYDISIPISHAVIPIITLLAIEIIIAFFVARSSAVKKAVEGMPSTLIYRGVLDQKELLRLNIGPEELLSQLRLNSVGDISSVDYAYLEQNGQLSVFTDGSGNVAHPLVINGRIDEHNLRLTGISSKRLNELLSSYGCTVKSTFLFTVDDSGNTYIIRKEV